MMVNPIAIAMAYIQLNPSINLLYLLWFNPKVWNADCIACIKWNAKATNKIRYMKEYTLLPNKSYDM